ncbi:TusE/DsrC/DsvC family sulfur relay protein [Stutzerimonas urumqiensis]|uniref:TusE/DsrC/DsvC family sulfur relay protein n=1 Tax=Stutzerimonas urumqiensis TaxID=638269 RepID=UPI003BA8C67F
MSELMHDGRAIALDPDGYLCRLDDWSEAVAQWLAEREGIQLTEAHWEILRLLRGFYAEFQLAPATRPLIRYVAQQLGPEKGNSLYLNRLFNGTPAKLAAKLAGLPKPSNCL